MMIDSVARALLDNRAINMATIIRKIEDVTQVFDPHVVKVVVDKNGFALYFFARAYSLFGT